MAGTAIGALVPLAFAETIHGNIVGFGAAVVLTGLVSSALKLEEGQRLGAATVALIMLTGLPGAPLLSATYRFLEVSLGIIVSLLVTRLLRPSLSRLSGYRWCRIHPTFLPGNPTNAILGEWLLKISQYSNHRTSRVHVQ